MFRAFRSPIVPVATSIVVAMATLGLSLRTQDSNQSLPSQPNAPIKASLQFKSELIAYDDFEDFSHTGSEISSSFGWSSEWQPACGDLQGSPETDVSHIEAFRGIDLSDQRILALGGGVDTRRYLSEPIDWKSNGNLYLSFTAYSYPGDTGLNGSLRVTLESNDHRLSSKKRCINFGFTTKGDPKIACGGGLSLGRNTTPSSEVRLCVVKFVVKGQFVTPLMQSVNQSSVIVEPESQGSMMLARNWSALGMPEFEPLSFDGIRITAGEDAVWFIDELRLGTTWRSVTEPFHKLSSDAPNHS